MSMAAFSATPSLYHIGLAWTSPLFSPVILPTLVIHNHRFSSQALRPFLLGADVISPSPHFTTRSFLFLPRTPSPFLKFVRCHQLPYKVLAYIMVFCAIFPLYFPHVFYPSTLQTSCFRGRGQFSISFPPHAQPLSDVDAKPRFLIHSRGSFYVIKIRLSLSSVFLSITSTLPCHYHPPSRYSAFLSSHSRSPPILLATPCFLSVLTMHNSSHHSVGVLISSSSFHSSARPLNGYIVRVGH